MKGVDYIWHICHKQERTNTDGFDPTKKPIKP